MKLKSGPRLRNGWSRAGNNCFYGSGRVFARPGWKGTKIMEQDKITERLSSIGYAHEDLTSRQRENILKIDEVLENRNRAILEAKTALKENRITVAYVAKEIGVSRGTIYNNSVYLDYINEFALHGGAADDEMDEVSRLRKENQDLQVKLHKMAERDVQILRLEKEIQEYENEIRRLQARFDQANIELTKMQEKLERYERRSDNKVKEFKPNKK